MTRSSYVIQWKSKVNGRAGRGTREFEKEEAEHLARELNEEYPQIHHEPVIATDRNRETEHEDKTDHHAPHLETEQEAQEAHAGHGHPIRRRGPAGSYALSE